MPELTQEQQARLDADAVYREPIGADEILLVGDLYFGIPILKRYDGEDAEIAKAMESGTCELCNAYLEWNGGSTGDALRAMLEVQRLLDVISKVQAGESLV
jgi:hypothetical protein